MPHPIMFRDDDPVLARVRQIALAFPQAFEKVSHGRPVFCAPKVFVHYSASVKPSAKGEHTQYPQSILVKADPSDRPALEADPRFFYPAYLGPSGWLGLDLTVTKQVDWDEVGELIDASFRLTAPKKLVKQLDQA
ncbi:MmcQ/YjbR family DNA-binding protein [Mycobacterium sp. IDR2000157661]|uniref:MmcQ/YjbR family DNA-binding protein n=1 Tax=Mycobacterium sp. IDR2000157661 TaxID=2867005 RepID=UPI001EEC9729|nr:MmcQ/YjbR family DNA-binding protein [Mycobacterium sp. IDR2000157661]ULE33217.1 MmcQ/YjbR family DNA-binding protein [Mycobacterium sp. IDR2000157661]